MIRKIPARGALCAAVVISALSFVPSSYSQAVEPKQPVPSADKSAADNPIPVETAPASATDADIIVMSPFEVNTGADKGYQATSTMAGSRINTKLKDVGASIQVVTGAFLRDTNAKNAGDLLILTTNTEVGGIGGNFLGAGDGAEIGTQTQRAQPQGNNRVRGLDGADNTRNYFPTDAPFDSYNTERVEIARGPNSILFGLGKAGGIINAGIRGADYKQSGQIEFRYSSFGSMRASIDYNHVLLKDELAVRVDGLKEEKKFKQKPAYNNDRRGFAALRYDPKQLNNDIVRTTIKANFETGKIRANNPDATPPIDAITPWFTTLNKATYDASLAWASTTEIINDPALASHRPGVLSEGSVSTGPGGYWNPWVGNIGRIYDNVVVAFGNPNSSAISSAFTGSNKALMAPGQSITGLQGAQLVGIRTYKDYAEKAKLPGYQLGVYKTKSITDASIFDYNNNLLGGPNDHQDEDWKIFNAELTQSFFDNRLAYSLSYDQQHYKQTQEFMFQGFANAITVDINSYLPDGSANPNVGRPVVASDSGNNSGSETWRDAARFTVTTDLRASDIFEKSSMAERILGHHSLTGIYTKESTENLRTQWSRWTSDDVYGTLIQSTSGPNRQIATMSYLGGSLLGADSASGAHLQGVGAVQSPYTTSVRMLNTQAGTIAGSFWENREVGIWNTANGDIANLYSNGSKVREEITTKAVVWQGYMMDNLFVPLVGIRKDLSRAYNAGSIPARSNGASDPYSYHWNIPTETTSPTSEYTVKTWGATLHSPAIINKYLPLGTNFSLHYNRSQNFQPAPNRIDINGEKLADPLSKTKDFGFTVSTLNDRIILKVTWFETRAANASIGNGVPGGFYMIGDAIAWGYLYGKQAQQRYGSFATDYAPRPGQTQAEATAEENAAVAAFFTNLQSDNFWKAWNIRGGGLQLTPALADANNSWQGWMEGPSSPNLAITGDTLSKGNEFELTARPLDNWDVTVNVSRTNATRLNLAGSVSKWIEDYHTFLEGPAGYLRLWGYDSGESEYLKNKFNNNTYSAYQLIKLQEGGNVPELRKWHVNVVSTYRFTSEQLGGALKGLRVGGAYRWQDKEIVGYGLNADATKVDINKAFKSPALTNIDFWIGYEIKVGKKLTWDIQFNAKNVFGKKDLIPVTVEPDGSWAQVRIPEPTIYSITNTLKF